jgi:hypothetical protein
MEKTLAEKKISMMRSLRKWRQQKIRELRMRDTIAETRSAIQAHFKLSKLPCLKRKGINKFSNNYLVFDGKTTLGILRMDDPHNPRKPLPSEKPYAAILDTRERIEHEWRCYEAGASQRLTPKPLWRSGNALMCEYLPYDRLLKNIKKHPDQAWDDLLSATRAIGKLHAAGIIHLDCWPQNIFKSPDGNHYFVDFEYRPAPFMSLAAQRVYDYLRMIETSWKFLPPQQRQNFGPWLDYFLSCLDDDMRVVDLSLLAPALPRITAAPGLGMALRGAFQPRT